MGCGPIFSVRAQNDFPLESGGKMAYRISVLCLLARPVAATKVEGFGWPRAVSRQLSALSHRYFSFSETSLQNAKKSQRKSLLAIASFAAAQSPATQSLRTPDGKPDLQGTWSFATVTPMEIV
jgi:hypothetical protein